MTRSGSLFGGSGRPRRTAMSAAYKKADTVNHEGFPAFTRSIEETTLALLMTNTLSNTFYATQGQMVKETVEVLQKMADKDPEFLAKALVYSRNKGLMKLVSTVGLAVLSASDAAGAKAAFRKAFRHVIRIPDDLREFVDLCKKGQIRKGTRVKVVTKVKDGKRVVVDRQVDGNGVGGLGGIAKLCVQNWLRHMSEYHAVKYGSAASKGVSLPDVVKLAHPKPKLLNATAQDNKKGQDYDRLRSGAQAELFGWLVKGWAEVGSEPSPSNPKVWAVEKIRRSDSNKEIVGLIEKYRLPQEAVIPAVKKMDTVIWGALLKGMPYMATLRQLNTMTRHQVFEDKTFVTEVSKRLSDKDAVLNSKQFPFRFLSAYKAFKGPQEIRDALVDALERSFVNMPEIKGLRVVISNDVSTSMDMKVVDGRKKRDGEEDTTPECREIAGIFAAALFKRCDDAVILPFNKVAQPELGRVSKRDSMMTIAQKISALSGGTNLGAPCEYMMTQSEKADVFILLTDDEDWAGNGFLTAFEAYKRQRNPDAKAFCIRLAPKGNFSAPQGYPDVHFIEGWSSTVLSYIPLILKSGGSQVDEVRKVDLDTFGKKEVVEEVVSSETED